MTGWWVPSPRTSWQIQFTGTFDPTVEAEVFILDLFDTPEATVGALHAQGRRVVCYFSAGSWEDWRPDAGAYPEEVLGRHLDGWPGERWVDVRRLDVLGPVIEARLDLADGKGCDGVDPDNVDAYTNHTGFPLTDGDQKAFNQFVARAAHKRAMAVGLKNDLLQVDALAGDFDFAVNEQCVMFDECSLLAPFVATGKPVFHIEYTLTADEFCPQAIARGFNSMRKSRELGPEYAPCQ